MPDIYQQTKEQPTAIVIDHQQVSLLCYVITAIIKNRCAMNI